MTFCCYSAFLLLTFADFCGPMQDWGMALSCSIGRGGSPLGMLWAWMGSGDGCSAVASCGLGVWVPALDRIHAFVSTLVFMYCV